MSKKRVYELAKELNTTSKRLIEKLAEIKIEVKNHMSLLEDNELEALYKHVGVLVKGDDEIQNETKKIPAQRMVSNDSDLGDKKKNAPRIIRKTEIVINTSEEDVPKGNVQRPFQSHSKEMNGQRKDADRRSTYVKKEEKGSGLLPGYARDNKPEYKNIQNKNTPKTNDGRVNTGISHTSQNEKVVPKEPTDAVASSVEKEKVPYQKKSEYRGEKNFERKPQQRVGERGAYPNKRPDGNSGGGDKPFNKQRPPFNQGRPFEKNNNQNANRPTDRPKYGATTDKKPFERSDNRKGGFNRGQNQGFDSRNRQAADKGKLEIPKSEVSTKDAEITSQKMEQKRELLVKDQQKEIKREQRKEKVTVVNPKQEKYRNNNLVFSEKKGVSEVLSEEFILNEFYKDEKVKKFNKGKKNQRDNYVEAPKAVLTSITIGESLTVKELAESLKKTAKDVITKLMGLGVMATLNQDVDFDTATLIAGEFGIKTEKAVVVTEEDILFDETEDAEDSLETRPPVVVVMGHVDHGKTSLLDAIRSTNVIDKEAGGITQHIGAYTVKINDRNITFLDTPGHEAFTAMRARGAQVTDIAILVVAADDGVMPQTIEAISHAKAANVTIIVAINKMDKEGANPDRVKQELAEHGLVPEEWGGDTICVPVSAKAGDNIEHLLEMVILSADILELKANPNRQAKGTIIESKLDREKGAIATMLVQRGTLKVGETIVTGTTVGRIRAMVDDKGKKITKAGPSVPVEILGLPDVPQAGEEFYSVSDERLAKQLAEKRRHKAKELAVKSTSRVTLDDLFDQIKDGKVKDLNIIVKADVRGSVEAVRESLGKLSNEEVRVKIVHGSVGAITESDVTLAQVSNAIIIGFNVRPPAMVTEMAKEAGVDLRLYRVIYNAIEDIEAAMKGMLDPTYKEVVLGHIEVRQTFKASGVGTIGGGYVTDGKATRSSEVRIVRDGVVVHEGKLASLKRFKDDAKEVSHGYECGILIEKFNDIKVGDVVECFVMEEVAR